MPTPRLLPLLLAACAGSLAAPLVQAKTVSDPLAALRAAQAMPLGPDRAVEEAQALSDLGARQAALTALGTTHSAKADALRARLTDRASAQAIHWATWDEAAATDRCGGGYQTYDAVVAQLQARLADPTLAPARQQALTHDLWVALDRAERYVEVVAGWDQAGRPTDLPPYAARAVADALAVQHRPREAFDLAHGANAQDPGPYDREEADPRQAEAWANYDRGHRAEGVTQMATILHGEPAYLALTMPPRYKENAFGTAADQNTWDMRADRGQLRQAQQGLQALVAAAPENAGFIQDVGGLMSRRHQIRAGQQQLARAQTLDPTYAQTQATWVGTDAQRHDAPAVEARLAPLVCRYPRSPVVQRTQDDWARQRGWQVDAEVRTEKGQAPDSGDKSFESELTAWSPLWDQHWRIGALYRSAYADLPEGGTWRNRVGLGVRYETRDVVAYTHLLAPQHAQTRQPAWEAGVEWAFADAWTVSVDGSTQSVDTPLRAEAYRIQGRSLQAALAFEPTDESSLTAKVGQLWFSDGNRRRTWALDGTQRVWTRPDWTITATAEVAGSTNSQPDRPYFDPRRDLAVLGGAVVENLMTAYGDNHRTTQRLEVQAGPYREQGYGRHWLAYAGYGQTYQWAPGRRWGWQLGYRSQTYDGQREHAWLLNLTFHGGD